MAKTVANKTGLYIVDPDRKGAVPSRPKDAKDNESQKAYYTRKYMEIHAARMKKGPPEGDPSRITSSLSTQGSRYCFVTSKPQI